MIKKVQSDCMEILKDIGGTKERIRTLEVLLTEKVDAEDFLKLKEFSKLLPTKDDVQLLHSYITESIQLFKKDNEDFKVQFKDHLEIIRRYDEVMSVKANKQAVIDIENRLSELFQGMLNTHDKRIQQNLSFINELQEKTADFQSLLQMEIETSVQKCVVNEIKKHENKKKKSQPKLMGLSGNLNEGDHSLVKILSLKADKDDLAKLHETKTSKMDTENLINLIIEINKIVQNVIVLQNETLKINLIKANDTRLARENRSH